MASGEEDDRSSSRFPPLARYFDLLQLSAKPCSLHLVFHSFKVTTVPTDFVSAVPCQPAQHVICHVPPSSSCQATSVAKEGPRQIGPRTRI